MDIRGNETLREMLAAEYAVGTLSGGARRRFERWMREDAALRRLAFEWSERLAPLTAGVEPVAPPERVWIAIQTRMRGARAAPVAVPWWDRVGLWRGLAGAFATVALVALAVALRESTIERPTTIVRVEQPAVEAPPKIVQAPPKIIEAPPKIVESPPKIVEVPALPDAVATIVDPKSGAPVAVVFEADHGSALLVKVAGNVDVAAGKDLQLWMAPRDAKGMVSLGVLPADAKDRPIRIDATTVAVADAATLGRVKAYGLSLEPAGGSPKPTHVLGLGAVARLAQ